MKELSDLMSPGSHLSDVPPDFHGMSPARYQLLQITAQAREWTAGSGRVSQLRTATQPETSLESTGRVRHEGGVMLDSGNSQRAATPGPRKAKDR